LGGSVAPGVTLVFDIALLATASVSAANAHKRRIVTGRTITRRFVAFAYSHAPRASPSLRLPSQIGRGIPWTWARRGRSGTRKDTRYRVATLTVRPLTHRLRLVVVLALVVAFAVPVAAAVSARKPATPETLENGRKLYRKYCGQCHALKAANAVGFGQDKLKTDPGPSLNNLRVTWNLCVQAIVLAIGGHETIQDKMTWAEISDVSSFVEKVTRGNKIPAKITGADFTSVLAPSK
jgi:mono/diheme cytochrome c family protein